MHQDGRPKLRIVGVGGGTGLAVLLAGLEEYAESDDRRADVDVTGIVSVADDGGSTGVLRESLGIPAVGDLRNCLVALARGNPLWGDLFQHRFAGGRALSGHALGNLIVAALVQSSGSLGAAIERLALPLGLRGHLLPVTESPVTLCAELAGGEIVLGESRITLSHRHIERVWLCPKAPPAAGVLDAIASADAIVLGPGSLFTSIVPNLLVDGVASAIRRSRGLRILVCNLLTELGETDGFDAARHLRVVQGYLGHGVLDIFLVNQSELETSLAERYATEGSRPVAFRHEDDGAGPSPVVADFLDRRSALGRHHPGKLAEAIVTLARHYRPSTPPAALVDARVPAALAPSVPSEVGAASIRERPAGRL